MFHVMWAGLRLLEKEINEYRKKIENTSLFVPGEWLPDNFTVEDMKEVLRRAIDAGKSFEEFMPDKYREHLKGYMEGIEEGVIY